MKKLSLRKYQKQKGLSLILLCLSIVLIILINLAAQRLEKEKSLKQDFSFNSITTMSEDTKAILSALPHPVHVYAVFSRGNEDQPLLDLLERYAAYSPAFTWEQTNLTSNPLLATRFSGSASGSDSVSEGCLVVSCEATGRWRILLPADFYTFGYDMTSGMYVAEGLRYESCITAATVYVTQAQVPQAKILSGHQELGSAECGPLEELL